MWLRGEDSTEEWSGLVQADILVINKTDLAPYVGADLSVMESDTKVVRGDRPYVMTNCKTGEG